MSDPTVGLRGQQGGSAGDRAVDGLLAGFGGAVAMMVVLFALGWLRATPPVQILRLFDATGNGSALLGLLLHLSTGGLYGILFGLGYRLLDRRGGFLPYAAGMAYGLLLWFLARFLLLPVAGSPLLALSQVDFLLAHLAYGLSTGRWLR